MQPIHVAVVQLNPLKGVGALDFNLAKVGMALEQASTLDRLPDVMVFPETALTGYFIEGGVAELALPSQRLVPLIAEEYRTHWPPTRPLEVVIGFYEAFEGSFYNSAAYLSLDGDQATLLHVHRKKFRPSYGVFDETRFVAAGKSFQAFDTWWGRAGMIICEDAWHSLSATIMALKGAEVLFIPAASPARHPAATEPANITAWRRLVTAIAAEHGIFVVNASLVGSEAGKLFGGNSILAGPTGDVLVEGPLFEESIVAATLEPALLAEARARAPLLENLYEQLPSLIADLEEALQRHRHPL
jgi:predicted amidohydrolase